MTTLTDQLKFSADSFNVAAQHRQIHVGLLLDLGDGRLFDVQCSGDFELRLARVLPQLAQNLDPIFYEASKTLP
jgi:hypothetical protein